jgi:chemotaxis regulatin CheY-phosphate phosphatase CheZ
VKEKRSIQRRQFDREKKMLESIGKIIRMAKERRRDTRLKEEVEVPESDFLKASKQLSKFG